MQTVRTWNGDYKAVLTIEQMGQLPNTILDAYYVAIIGICGDLQRRDVMILQLQDWFDKQPKKEIPDRIDPDQRRYQELKTLGNNLGMTEEEVL